VNKMYAVLSMMVFFLLAMFHFQLYAEDIQSQDSIYITDFKTVDVPEAHASIFRDVLTAELTKQGQRLVSDKNLATHVVEGSLSRLGEKVIILMKALEKQSEEFSFVQRVTLYNESELDVAAERLAKAYNQSKSFSETVDVTNVIKKEEEIVTLKHALSGTLFEMGTFTPIGGDNYGEGESGIALNMSWIHETPSFFYLPSIGFRIGADRSYRELPLDISVGKFFSDKNNTLYIAGGAGLRFIREELTINTAMGTTIIRTVNQTLKENDMGAGLHVKVGYLLFRERAARVSVALRYDVSNADPLERDLAQALSLQIGLMAF